MSASVNHSVNLATAVIGRDLYTMPVSLPNSMPSLVSSLPIPGAAAVIACDVATIMLENGEVWRWGVGGSSQWELIGTFGGPTSAQRESFGALKSRYRGEARQDR